MKGWGEGNGREAMGSQTVRFLLKKNHCGVLRLFFVFFTCFFFFFFAGGGGVFGGVLFWVSLFG